MKTLYNYGIPVIAAHLQYSDFVNIMYPIKTNT
jgi:hypothetical protein